MSRPSTSAKKRATRKRRLYQQQDGACAGCKQPIPEELMTFDHVFPQSKAETPQRRKRGKRRARSVHDFRNIVLLCRPCNAFKAHHYPWNWNDYVWDPQTQSLKTRLEMERYYDSKERDGEA